MRRDQAEAAASRARFLGLLRVCRANIQDIQRSLRRVAEPQGACSHVDLQLVCSELKQVLQRDLPQIAQNQRAIQDCLNRNPVLLDYVGDDVRDAETRWEQARALLLTMKSPNALVRSAPCVNDLLDDVIIKIGAIAIAPRLRQHLEDLRPGQVLDFQATFENELPPRVSAQQQVLTIIAQSPKYVNGVIDVAGLRVWKASPRLWRRVLSFVYILLAAGAVTAIFALVLPGIPQLKVTTPQRLVPAYLLALAGAMGHVLISAVKQVRRAAATKTGGSVQAIGQWGIWIHVHELYICASAATVGVAAAAVLLKTSDAVSMLLAGYSVTLI